MIAAPVRTVPTGRAPAAGSRVPGAQGGDADNTAALAALDARITTLVARASTPEDEELEQQREAFDAITRARAELDRETNALRDLAMEQMKQDDEILKKWIALI